MRGTTYRRVHIPVVVRTDRDGGLTIRLGPEADAVVYSFAPGAFRALTSRLGEPGEEARAILQGMNALYNPRSWQLRGSGHPTVSGALSDDLRLLIERTVGTLRGRPKSTFPRVEIEVDDPALAALPWEGLLDWAVRPFPRVPVVRVSRVWPRSRSLSLSIPLRFLEVGELTKEPGEIQRLIALAFNGSVPTNAAVMARCTLPDLLTWQATSGWPAADVIHISDPVFEPEPAPFPPSAVPDRLHQLALDWFGRLTDTWQTRLVVFEARDLAVATRARGFAAALAARGGPAVLVVAGADRSTILEPFYDRLIHDHPLDLSPLRDAAFPPTEASSLFVGAGRSELLRVSSVAAALERMIRRGGDEVASLSDRARARVRTIEKKREADIELTQVLVDIRDTWPTMISEALDSNAFAPLAHSLGRLRGLTGVTSSVAEESVISGSAARGQAGSPAPRYVNAHLALATRRPRAIKPSTAGLRPGVRYLLAVSVGERDPLVPVINASALVEEVFRWSPESEGTWAEIGVTGLDFEIDGDPVQEFWLPRDALVPTHPVYFTVVPKSPGAARLRFSLYHQQNIVQSFRLVAWVRDPAAVADAPADVRRNALAAAADLDPTDVGDSGYVVRLEYSLRSSAEGLLQTPKRILSLVANDYDGTPVITVKGAGTFGVCTNQDLKDYVTLVRSCLFELAGERLMSDSPPSYVFSDDLNDDARVETLKKLLPVLAKAGWSLFVAVIDEAAQDRVRRLLDTGPGTIAVAHLLLEKVIPWAAVYDRPYDPDAAEIDGVAVDHDTCLAPLETGADGRSAVNRCGTHPRCLLSEQVRAQRRHDGTQPLSELTVVCPLHFWGFRHVIEIPPRQVDQEDRNAAVDNTPVWIESDVRPHLFGGYHSKLSMAEEHLGRLVLLAASAAADWHDPFESDRDRVLTALKAANLDLAYFYCHARGGEADREVVPPRLEFQAPGAQNPGAIDASALPVGVRWSHRPLVFLNGCSTAAFSPDALSPFVRRFVNTLGASGVIATEVPVFEPLAVRVAEIFLGFFLGQKLSAGESMYRTRQALLRRYDPFGLAYTLYAPAELTLAIAAPMAQASHSPAPVAPRVSQGSAPTV